MNEFENEGLDISQLRPEEVAALRRLARQQLDKEESETAANTPFERTYAKEVERLRATGIEVRDERHCWLQGKLHDYKGRYMSGRPAWGYSWRLCVRCGHSTKSMLIGGAARTMM